MLHSGKRKIGVDLVSISRISRLIQDVRWLERVYTSVEIQLAEGMSADRRAEFLAGRFAVKEAVVKAAGVGFGAAMGLHDIETVRLPNGAPEVRLSDQALNSLREMGLAGECEVSISHSPDDAGSGFAVAMVLLG